MCPPPYIPTPQRHRIVIELDCVTFLDAYSLEKKVKSIIADANKCGAIKDEKVIIIEKPL